MNRRVILITNEESHHRFWVSGLEKSAQVIGIIWVRPEKEAGRIKRGVQQRGLIWLMLKLMDGLYQKFSSSSFTSMLNASRNKYFNQYKDYSPQAEQLISMDVNNEETISFIKKLNPEFVCFLGGDIARKHFFEQMNCPVLNYHSGLSPLYNGSGTTFHAVANNRPNFCGGTLMLMNEKIDGGAVLGYYLPAIEASDTAADLFCKGISGSVKLYSAYLNHLDPIQLKGLEQGRSVLYYRSNDWTISRDLDLAEFEHAGKMARYKRTEEYWLFEANTNWSNELGVLMSKLLNKN